MKKLYVANVIFTTFSNERKYVVAFTGMNDLKTSWKH